MKNEITAQKEYKLISLIYAYIISITTLNLPISVFFHTGGMVLNICVVLALSALNIKQMVDFKISIRTLMYILLIMAIYIFTKVVSRSTITRNEFYFYFMLSSLIGTYRCDYERVLRYIMHISLLIIPCTPVVFGNLFETGVGGFLSMGTSFAVLPGFMAGIIHFFFFRRKGKLLDKLCYITDAFFLFMLVIRGNRNMVFTAMITLFCLYMKNWGKSNKRKKITFRLLLVIVLIVIIFVNFYDILAAVDNFLQSFGIEARFIKKTIQMRDRGDVSNGRLNIFRYTIREIKKSPAWGHGISTIYHNSGNRIIYPHNFVLQLLYDGGIFLTVPIFLILFKAIRYAFKGQKRNAAVFFLYMLLITIPKMSLSTDLWKNHAFWLMIAHVIQFYPGKLKLSEEVEVNDNTISETVNTA